MSGWDSGWRTSTKLEATTMATGCFKAYATSKWTSIYGVLCFKEMTRAQGAGSSGDMPHDFWIKGGVAGLLQEILLAMYPGILWSYGIIWR